MKKTLLILLLLPIFVSAVIPEEVSVYVAPKEGGERQPSENFAYTFNFTSDQACTSVLLSISENVTTDTDGIGFITLDISSLTSVPSYLCEYRDGVLQTAHYLNPNVFGDVNSSVNSSQILSVLTTNGYLNSSSILNGSNILVGTVDESFIDNSIARDSELYTDGDIDGSETAFDGWDKDESDDFDGEWSSLTSVPSGFADGVDNDTTYANVSEFANDAGYITGYTETDPSWSANFTNGYNKSSWDEAYGWGDHAGEGYLTSFSESDPLWGGNESLVCFLADDETITGNWTFTGGVQSNDWGNVTLTENQILDLSHTVDTNETDRVDALVTANISTNLRVDAVNSTLSSLNNFSGESLNGSNIDSGVVDESFIDSDIARDSELIGNCSGEGSCSTLLYETELDEESELNAQVGITVCSVENGLCNQTDTTLTNEQVQDIMGAMVSGNTETLISVNYNDAGATLNFIVDDDLANYDNTPGFLTTETGDIEAVIVNGDFLNGGASSGTANIYFNVTKFNTSVIDRISAVYPNLDTDSTDDLTLNQVVVSIGNFSSENDTIVRAGSDTCPGQVVQNVTVSNGGIVVTCVDDEIGSGGDGSGGWTNTSSDTSTDLDVIIGNSTHYINISTVDDGGVIKGRIRFFS